VNVDTNVAYSFYLALDPGLNMASTGSALADDMLRRAFVTPEFQQAVKPVMGVEEFNATPSNRK